MYSPFILCIQYADVRFHESAVSLNDCDKNKIRPLNIIPFIYPSSSNKKDDVGKYKLSKKRLFIVRQLYIWLSWIQLLFSIWVMNLSIYCKLHTYIKEFVTIIHDSRENMGKGFYV